MHSHSLLSDKTVKSEHVLTMLHCTYTINGAGIAYWYSAGLWAG
jgi:hypothetical protein